MIRGKSLRWPAAVLTSLLILTGCSSQSNQSQPAASHKSSSAASKVVKSESSQASSSAESSSSSKVATTLWDTKKDDQLESFINQWAPTMNQSYDKYDGTNDIKIDTGMVYPADFNKITVEGSNDSIGWSKDGQGHYDYNVVAIYNYDGEQNPAPEHITYFFAFHNGQPVALVDQSTNGTPDFTATKNTKVQENFESIAGNSRTADTQSSTDDSSQSTTLTHDPKIIGLMAREKVLPGDDYDKETNLGIYTYHGTYWIGIGTAISTVGYKINGDTITYYSKDYSGGRDTAHAIEVPHQISLRKLQDEYYSTAHQKQYFDRIASTIPPIEEQSDDD